MDLANRCRGGCELRVPSNRVWLVGRLELLDLIGGTAHGLFMINIELGKRAAKVALDFTKI